MIHIDRPAQPALDVFDKATVKLDGNKVSRARRELGQAMTFFTDATKFKNDKKITDQTFSFKVYKDKDLAKALHGIFGNKCAYCESDFGAVTPKDIEHFRPKSEVELEDGTSRAPGYFWLAGDWTNLLVSCPDCNRAREHEVPGETEKVRLGKQARFPLSDESKRIRDHQGSVADEEPARLLIDPCNDDPENFLRYDDKGLIHSRADQPAHQQNMAEFSIRVYALQRKPLVEARLKVLLEVIFQIEQLRIAAIELGKLKDNHAPQADVDAKGEQIRKLRDHLAGFTRGKAEYLGIVRAHIRNTKASGGFNDLLNAGMDPETLL